MSELIRDLEDAIVDAWPAAECEDQDGWWLRASGGPTHRANSVATHSATGELALPERIARAEAFYRARNLPPLIQIGPLASPKGLDLALEERGYRRQGESQVMLASPSEVLARLRRTHETSVGTQPSEAWLQHAGRESRHADSYSVFTGILSRLGTRCRFVTARDARGVVTGTCLGISSEARLGVYAMLTSPQARRRGTGTALLRALAETALAESMSELYLMVQLDNGAARPLYTRAGFAEVYRYHYRALA